MSDRDLDELMSDEFLNSLEDPEHSKEPGKDAIPIWLSNDKAHTTRKAWEAILALKAEKEVSIKSLGKVADNKTAKSIYQIKKSEVSKVVGISAQSIFNASSFSRHLLRFFNDVNSDLLDTHKTEQKKQLSRIRKKGVRSKKKGELVEDVQDLRDRVRKLECFNVRETLNLLLSQLPLDLQRQLKK
ncbi:hypothetical protein Q4493_00205 [Colwellia sp. 1_MG-2023]|uniref:hypothetical protein n=1 Tax=Colwellia sp. 1_MG-2023 TaxID=3062649 RepID=UPI0026E22B06|nr:hypothetical protein [Colwellia sp. 1_MG-2023]MDO6444185.1 hypothetical protein [Colwellia sp. 1_MG-2023]